MNSEQMKEMIRIREEDCLADEARKKLDEMLTEKMFQNRENGRRHNPYDQELRELSAIEHGDVQALERSILEVYEGEIGMLSRHDSLRNTKNLGIVVITTSSRAAIRGGLLPELSFSMSDVYINAIEEALDPQTVGRITRGAQYRFARLVSEQKSGKARQAEKEQAGENEHVSRAKDYIFQHLHGRIRVEEIAEELALHPRYLSTLFRQQTGMTLSQYILTEKLRLVRNLLTYSEYSYLDIANYLGFASQSHLGEVFRREMGMTMKEYRTKYQQRSEFTSE